MTPQTRANSSKLDSNELSSLLGGAWAAGAGPLYRRLADQLDQLIDASALRDGQLLPAERDIAAGLGVSRSTVVSALDLLRQRGSVKSRQGSGTRVQGPAPPNHDPAEFRGRSIYPEGPELADLTKACPAMLPEADALYRRLIAEGLAIDASMDPSGTPALREAVASWYTDLGLPTEPNEIAITNGAQQGVALSLSVLCRPGDVVLAEAATWPGFTDAVHRLGGRMIGVRMDADGIDPAELRSAVERFRPAAITLNPHHQNPTGTRLTPARREAIAQISAEYRVPLIEDRVAALLSFDGVVPRTLAAERPDAPIIVADSLSKVVWPGLRLGWVRASRSVLTELRLAKSITDIWTSNLTQALGIAFLAQLDELLPQRVARLAASCDLAIATVARELPDWRVARPDGGMVLWAQLPAPVARRFVHHAAAHGVQLAQADAFAVEGDIADRVRIPFTGPAENLVEGISRLGQAWRTFDARATPEHSATNII